MPTDPIHHYDGKAWPEHGSIITVTKLMYFLDHYPVPQYKVAALAGIPPSRLSDYVRGKAPLSPKHLVALCELFQCEPDELLGTITVEVDRPVMDRTRAERRRRGYS